MNDPKRAHRLFSALLLGFMLTLLAVGVALAAVGNIDATNKWAWGANVGWLNFAPDNGGVTVYSDHLEGYAWAENVGWIKLGACTGGSPCTHANTAADNYGVNNDGTGRLSGYAWSTTVGWINFDPAGAEQVTIDPITGNFAGYAWGENVGWIHFQGSSPAYKTQTTLTLSPTTPLADQPFSLNATVALSPTVAAAASADVVDAAAACPLAGEVAFYRDGQAMGSAPLGDGCRAVLAVPGGLPAGTYRFVAQYTGDGRHLPSDSALVITLEEEEQPQMPHRIILPLISR